MKSVFVKRMVSLYKKTSQFENYEVQIYFNVIYFKRSNWFQYREK